MPQLTHALSIDGTDAKHYRWNDSEMILTEDVVRLITPGDQLGVYSFRLHPEVAFAFAQRIIAFYDEGNLSGEAV